ncbi:MAG TPA: thermonuclease family protein [Candidatus Nanoarchaeia archaeon]|nr:thermonuclease family protein [Candidatus Nanoarchaeia archaeon]
MDKKGSSWWTWFLIILFLMIMSSAIRNSYYRHSMYRQMMYDDQLQQQLEDDMYDDQLQQQLEDDVYDDQLQQQLEDDMYDDMRYDDMRRDDMYNDMYDDMRYDDMMRDLYEDDLRRGAYGNYYPASQNQEEQDLESEEESITVSYVLDGDTFKLSNGKTVRLIGLNAPESGQSCSSEATAKLNEFVLGKEVTLEQDADNEDQYGRLLRYVYVGNTFVNLEIVELGLAHKYEYGSNTKYSSEFEQAENEAKQIESCLWKSEEVNYIQDKCIYVTNFHFNSAGDDNYNLNDEYVTFGNKCSYSISMDSWTVKDETASHIYAIPSFAFQSGATFTLYTGTGTNTNSALYWGRISGDYAAIWNNGGDTLFLRDSNGNLVLSKSYSGY